MNVRLWCAAAVLGLAAPALGAEPAAQSRLVEALGPLAVGKPVPSFAGWSVDGRMVSLSLLLAPPRAEPAEALVVSFFATWCEPCVRAMPMMQRALSASGPAVKGVLVAHGEDAAAVKPFLDARGVALPTILDPFLKLSQRLGVTALPRTFVVNRSGQVSAIFQHEGADFEEALLAAIERARAERAVVQAVAR
jgi:thiol-disulfide isomerase/thioredoxin